VYTPAVRGIRGPVHAYTPAVIAIRVAVRAPATCVHTHRLAVRLARPLGTPHEALGVIQRRDGCGETDGQTDVAAKWARRQHPTGRHGHPPLASTARRRRSRLVGVARRLRSQSSAEGCGPKEDRVRPRFIIDCGWVEGRPSNGTTGGSIHAVPERLSDRRRSRLSPCAFRCLCVGWCHVCDGLG
jgi:hypothetical protein